MYFAKRHWLLPLFDEIQNTKKLKTRESKEKKFGKKLREIGCIVLIFGFLLSIAEVGRW